MHKLGTRLTISAICLTIVAVLLLGSSAYAFKQRVEKNAIEAKEFASPELYISQTPVPLDQALNQLPNKAAWNTFLNSNVGYAFIDMRSGRPAALTHSIPLIPGTGDSNNITFESLSKILGYKVERITENVVKDAALWFVKQHADVLNINPAEIGRTTFSSSADGTVWTVFFWRQINGIPVRDSNISISINHGNVEIWGVEKWGDVNISTVPSINEEQALNIGFNYIGGRFATDKLLKNPSLEIIPIAPAWDGSVTKGYDHILAWVFTFQREGYANTWQTTIEAQKGKVVAFQDKNLYLTRKIVGSIYPISNDNCSPQGVAEYQTPAMFMNTGLAAPNNYTDMGGNFNYTSGTVTTTLDGRYVQIGTDSCGAVSETSTTGNIDLLGTNGDHNCTVPTGHSAGDTFSSRSCSIEITHTNRIARSWVNVTWLDNTSITCNVNINSTCNAYSSGNTVNFYRSGGGCGNTGEIAAVFDHEWGHGFDANDAGGSSSPGEVFADVNANMRLQTSCTGEGFFVTLSRGCGQWTCPSSGSLNGYNCSGYGDCCTGCTGVRDQDYHKHTSGVAHTPANFICVHCSAGSQNGPCGKETHCENAPAGEAAWDFAASDLEAAPFNLDLGTAFEIARRDTYIGMTGVTNWYSCTCPSTSSGCAATNAYMRWLTADDTDGNANNGTPHMTAIYAAFNRHAIACASPTPTNSGCSTVLTAPTLTATPGDTTVALSWTAVTGASSYNVFRTEGPSGCNYGSEMLTNVTTTTYNDNQVQNGRTYYYTVQAVGSNAACLGPVSNCVSAIPNASTCTAPTFGGVQSVADVNACTATGIRINWNVPTSWGTGATGGTYDIRRYTTAGCTGGYTTVRTGLAGTNTTYVDTSGTAGTTYYYQINAINNCTTPLSSTGTNSCSAAIVDAVDTTPCPNVGNTLKVTKSGTNASVAWTTVTCTDIAGYRIYGSTTYSATFPTGWTLIATPTAPPQTDPLASTYVAYKGVSLDACGNASSN